MIKLDSLDSVGSNNIGSWVKYSNGLLIQFWRPERLSGQLFSEPFNLPTSFKNSKYSISAGIWATASSVFHVAPYSASQYVIDYQSLYGQNASNIYIGSSFIAVGFWK